MRDTGEENGAHIARNPGTADGSRRSVIHIDLKYEIRGREQARLLLGGWGMGRLKGRR